jgi:sugar lactone lactonase YvrE
MGGMQARVELLQDSKDGLGEGPLWDQRDNALYWVDIDAMCVHRYHLSTDRKDTFRLGVAPTVLGLRAIGGFVMGTSKGFAFWDPRGGELEMINDPEADSEESRFNDGAVDRQGRFWAGTYAKKTPTNLYRLDPDLSVHKMEEGLTVANGIGWSTDNRTMYFTDTRIRMIYAYDFEATTGAISNRRPFVHTPDSDDVPDGLSVDSEGFVWSTRFGGWRIVRYNPRGIVEREVMLPVKYPTSCTFGGPNYRDLFITSSRRYVPAAELTEQPLAGSVFRLETDVEGLENPLFRG